MTILVSFAKLLGTWWLEPCGWLLACLVGFAVLKNWFLGMAGRFRVTTSGSKNSNTSVTVPSEMASQSAKVEASARVVRTAISGAIALTFLVVGFVAGYSTSQLQELWEVKVLYDVHFIEKPAPKVYQATIDNHPEIMTLGFCKDPGFDVGSTVTLWTRYIPSQECYSVYGENLGWATNWSTAKLESKQ